MLKWHEAGSLEEACRCLESMAADIVLVDLALGPLRGIGALKALWTWLDGEHHKTRILVLAGSPESKLMRQSLHTAPAKFLPNGGSRRTSRHSLTPTLSGGDGMSDKPDASLWQRAAPEQKLNGAIYMSRLTVRERAVAAQVAKGHPYKRIAQRLQERDGRPVSEHTVRAHVGNIAGKLGVTENGKAGVMARIAQLGLVFDDD